MHIHQIPVKDHQTLKTLADEIRIFEEILHPNLVLFYGVEIYRVSLLSALSFYRAMLRKACQRGNAFVSVRLFVCLPQAGNVSKRLYKWSWSLACRLPSTYPTL